ncbi:MAG: MraY family glycosyltransferase [Candidatus Firestonebacteria bacterium]
MKTIHYTLIVFLLIFFVSPFGGVWFYLHELRWAYVLLLSCFLATVLTPVVERIAFKFKILDYPNERKIHKKPTPRLGGLAIFLAFVLTVIRNFHFSQEVTGIILGSSIIFLFGLLDDIFSISAFLRLFGQILAALIVVKSGICISLIPYIPGKEIIQVVLTVFWIVGITNAINFLDGVDGLATGLTIISAICFFIIFWPSSQFEHGYIIIALVGACLGFLSFNLKPARVFLGDGGATLLGFLISVFAVIGTLNASNTLIAASIPVLILGVPIFDMIYITISRIKNGAVKNVKEWIEYTGKDHFHHRLLKIGFSEQVSVFFLYSLSFCLGLGAIVLKNAGNVEAFLLLLQALIIFGIIVVLMLTGREIS